MITDSSSSQQLQLVNTAYSNSLVLHKNLEADWIFRLNRLLTYFQIIDIARHLPLFKRMHNRLIYYSIKPLRLWVFPSSLLVLAECQIEEKLIYLVCCQVKWKGLIAILVLEVLDKLLHLGDILCLFCILWLLIFSEMIHVLLAYIVKFHFVWMEKGRGTTDCSTQYPPLVSEQFVMDFQQENQCSLAPAETSSG